MQSPRIFHRFGHIISSNFHIHILACYGYFTVSNRGTSNFATCNATVRLRHPITAKTIGVKITAY